MNGASTKEGERHEDEDSHGDCGDLDGHADDAVETGVMEIAGEADAYETDVRPLLAQVRVEMALDPDPIAAYHASDYPVRVAQERGSGVGSGGGYPGA